MNTKMSGCGDQVFSRWLWIFAAVTCTRNVIVSSLELNDGTIKIIPSCDKELNGCEIVVIDVPAEYDPFAELQSCMSSTYRQVTRDSICNEDVVCDNLTPCDLKCESHYRCLDSTKCVLRSTVCDTNYCEGCPEDHKWTNGVGFKCKRSGEDCVLPQQLLHDDIQDCDGGTDICFGSENQLNATSRNDWQDINNIKKDKCFICLESYMIIPLSRVCDRIFDCDDMTDECLCEGDRPDICEKIITHESEITMTDDSTKNDNLTPFCDVGHVMCSQRTCIPKRFVCDGFKDCDEDESYEYCGGTLACADALGYEKTCRCSLLNGCESLLGTACDGVGNCFGKNEESFKFASDECVATCSKDESNFTCIQEIVFGVGTPISQDVCRRPDGANSSQERQYFENNEVCDGKLNCPLGEDESDCPDRFECESKQTGYISIEMGKTCDGVEDCKDGLDETMQLCNETRFHCSALGGTKVNIDRKFICDYHIGCDDASDEKNCTDDRFYCENEKPIFVRSKKKFDGYGDCSDWSDECPLIDQSTNNGFSSRYELIANPILRALVWIMGLLSICGNATVLFRETRKTQVKKKLSANVMANKFLVINLAASDIIMGVYLLSLGIASLTMQGFYCSNDLIWRSSNACIALGVMSVVSSESSVITMILLTGCRLYAIYQPFKSSNEPRKRTVCLMIFLAWTISITFAVIPLFPHLSNTFVTDAQFEYSPYSRNAYMPLDSARQLFKRLLTFDKDPNVTISNELQIDKISWKEMERLSDTYFLLTRLKIIKKFGYYSVNSVCLPNFFASRSDRAWSFSFFINLFNFVSFTFVASAYAAIYIRSQKRANLRASTQQAEGNSTKVMQRKILRLIITDFCCWIPICVMAFIKLGDVYLSNDAYVVAAIVLLPINSALNPILYSDLPDAFYKKVVKSISMFQDKLKSRNDNSSSGIVQSTNLTPVPNNSSNTRSGENENIRSDTNI